jgi:hypothetical protein
MAELRKAPEIVVHEKVSNEEETQTDIISENNEELEIVKGERDKLLGDINYLKKKMQTLVQENEKMQRAMQRQGLEMSQDS